MQAHKVIESIESLNAMMKHEAIHRPNGPNASQDQQRIGIFSQMIESIKISSKFSYDGDLPNLGSMNGLSEADLTEKTKKFKLPFDLCYFSFRMLGVLFSKVSEDCICYTVYYPLKNVPFYTVDPLVTPYISLIDGKIGFNGNNEITKEVLEDEHLVLVLRSIPAYSLMFMELLECSNIYIKNNAPDAKLQKSRIKKGKLPIFEYKTLEIKLSDKHTNVSNGNGRSHASPRLHMRRGHIRRLPKESVWVQPCVVGDKKKGLIFKDYKVTK